MLNVNVERCGAHRINDRDMKIAVIPSDDSRTVLLPKIDLSLTDHLDAPSPAKTCRSSVDSAWVLIYHASITAETLLQSAAEGTGPTPSIMRPTAGFRRASSGLPAKIISPRSMT